MTSNGGNSAETDLSPDFKSFNRRQDDFLPAATLAIPTPGGENAIAESIDEASWQEVTMEKR